MRKSLSTKLAAGVLGMGLAAAPSLAEIKVSDALSLTGFLDMSSTYGMPATGPSSVTASFDQFELDFMYKFADNLSLRADMAQGGVGGGAGALAVEQAYLTYKAGSLTVDAGKFLSVSGWESAEPTGLYQFSVSKNLTTAGAYGGYHNGVGVGYAISPMISVYGAALSSVWTGDTDLKDPGFEAQVTLAPVAGLTVKAAYLYESFNIVDDTGAVVDDTKQSLINVWASYATGPITVAAEVNVFSDWTAADDKGLGYLGMVNYKLTDKIAATARYSSVKFDALYGAAADSEIAISPSYAISPSWLVLAEVQRELDAEKTTIAVESLLMF